MRPIQPLRLCGCRYDHVGRRSARRTTDAEIVRRARRPLASEIDTQPSVQCVRCLRQVRRSETSCTGTEPNGPTRTCSSCSCCARRRARPLPAALSTSHTFSRSTSLQRTCLTSTRRIDVFAASAAASRHAPRRNCWRRSRTAASAPRACPLTQHRDVVLQRRQWP
jgi:hypothetical protein